MPLLEWQSLRSRENEVLPSGRWGHSLTVISPQFFVVIGGLRNGEMYSDVWIFDVDNRRWSRPSVQGTLPTPRWGHTATLIAPHIILLLGGREGSKPMSFGEYFTLNLKTMTWTHHETLKPAPKSRYAHSALWLGQTRQILIFGGHGGRARYYNDLHVLQLPQQGAAAAVPATGGYPLLAPSGSGGGSSSLLASLLPPSWRRGLLRLDSTEAGGSGGGDSTTILPPPSVWGGPTATAGGSGSLGQHRDQGSGSIGREGGEGVLAPGGSALLSPSSGGQGPAPGHVPPQHPAPPQAQWLTPPVNGTPPCKRSGHTMTRVGQRIIVIGGYNGKEILHDLCVLHIPTWTWSCPIVAGSGLPPIVGHSADLVPGTSQIVVFGGSVSATELSCSLYVIDTDVWASTALHQPQAPAPRFWHRTTVIVSPPPAAATDREDAGAAPRPQGPAQVFLLVFGGSGERGQPYNDCNALDLTAMATGLGEDLTETLALAGPVEDRGARHWGSLQGQGQGPLGQQRLTAPPLPLAPRSPAQGSQGNGGQQSQVSPAEAAPATAPGTGSPPLPPAPQRFAASDDEAAPGSVGDDSSFQGLSGPSPPARPHSPSGGLFFSPFRVGLEAPDRASATGTGSVVSGGDAGAGGTLTLAGGLVTQVFRDQGQRGGGADGGTSDEEGALQPRGGPGPGGIDRQRTGSVGSGAGGLAVGLVTRKATAPSMAVGMGGVGKVGVPPPGSHSPSGLHRTHSGQSAHSAHGGFSQGVGGHAMMMSGAHPPGGYPHPPPPPHAAAALYRQQQQHYARQAQLHHLALLQQQQQAMALYGGGGPQGQYSPFPSFDGASASPSFSAGSGASPGGAGRQGSGSRAPSTASMGGGGAPYHSPMVPQHPHYAAAGGYGRGGAPGYWAGGALAYGDLGPLPLPPDSSSVFSSVSRPGVSSPLRGGPGAWDMPAEPPAPPPGAYSSGPYGEYYGGGAGPMGQERRLQAMHLHQQQQQLAAQREQQAAYHQQRLHELNQQRRDAAASAAEGGPPYPSGPERADPFSAHPGLRGSTVPPPLVWDATLGRYVPVPVPSPDGSSTRHGGPGRGGEAFGEAGGPPPPQRYRAPGPHRYGSSPPAVMDPESGAAPGYWSRKAVAPDPLSSQQQHQRQQQQRQLEEEAEEAGAMDFGAGGFLPELQYFEDRSAAAAAATAASAATGGGGGPAAPRYGAPKERTPRGGIGGGGSSSLLGGGGAGSGGSALAGGGLPSSSTEQGSDYILLAAHHAASGGGGGFNSSLPRSGTPSQLLGGGGAEAAGDWGSLDLRGGGGGASPGPRGHWGPEYASPSAQHPPPYSASVLSGLSITSMGGDLDDPREQDLLGQRMLRQQQRREQEQQQHGR